MRRRIALASIVMLCALTAWGAEVSGKVIKVLPHFLDVKGKHALSPSLYDRDAYQALLRSDPEKCSGMRFDVHWKAKRARDSNLRLRLELITANQDDSKPLVIETPVRAKRGWGRWDQIPFTGDAFRRAGKIVAWRVSLWDGDRMVADNRSFLW